MAYQPLSYKLLGLLKGANLNTTSDQAITVLNATKYIIDKIIVTNASATPTLAAGGFYSAASKGGTVIVGTGQVFTALSAVTKFIALTLALTTDSLAAQTLYLSLTTANGSALTADVYIYGFVL
jgi:hypothetical protein